MINRIKLKYFGLLIFILGSCDSKPGANLYFQLNKDSSKIVLSGLDYALIESLRSDTTHRATLQQIFQVYRQTQDNSMAGFEKPERGTYIIEQEEIQFKPDSGFIKGETYRAELHQPAYYSAAETLLRPRIPGKDRTISRQFRF